MMKWDDLSLTDKYDEQKEHDKQTFMGNQGRES